MAASAPPSCISTNPNPRLLPVSLSVATRERDTGPYTAHMVLRSSEVAVEPILPMKSFFTKHPPRPRSGRRKQCAPTGDAPARTEARTDRAWEPSPVGSTGLIDLRHRVGGVAQNSGTKKGQWERRLTFVVSDGD